jgi:hypothetical protein
VPDWSSGAELVAGAVIDNDPELIADLTGVQYGYAIKDGRDAIQLEKKEDMKKRGLASIILWAADRHLHLVAPSMQTSNTGRAPFAPQREFTPLVDDDAALRWSDGGQDSGPWRKIDVILSRHDLRERDHQRRQGNTDNGLRG